MAKICIDAGHYAKYNRSPGVPEYYESDMVWKLSNLQKKYLEELGHTVVMTRSNKDKDLALQSRGKASKGCDLFISNHSNAVGGGMNESVKYAAIYHLTDDKTTDCDDISREFASKIAPVIANVMGVTYKILSRKSENDRNGDGFKNDNYYGVLHGARLVNTPGLILEHGFHTNTETTKWLLKDENLDRMAKAEAECINAFFGGTNKIPESKPEVNVSDNAEVIWKFLKSKGLTDFATAGFMGNLQAESGLRPNNLQNSFENKLDLSDDEYTTGVDNGTYDNFVRDSAGYGLAQWTYWSRKENMLNYAKSVGKSIGDLGMQLDFLWKEISEKYTPLIKMTNDAKTVREASNAVLLNYERPKDQGEKVQARRAELSQVFYDRFAITTDNTEKEEVEDVVTTTTFPNTPFSVTVLVSDLNYRSEPSMKGSVKGVTGKGKFTIVEVSNGWGKLKSGVGWIYLANSEYCTVNTTVKEDVKTDTSFKVRVEISNLNIRSGAGMLYSRLSKPIAPGIYTIVEVAPGAGSKNGWGKLKSGAGWISLDYATRV